MGTESIKTSQKNETVANVLYNLKKLALFAAGAFAIYLGYRLFVLGVTGQASLILDISTIKGRLVNAAPGLFFAIGGSVIIILEILKGGK